ISAGMHCWSPAQLRHMRVEPLRNVSRGCDHLFSGGATSPGKGRKRPQQESLYEQRGPRHDRVLSVLSNEHGHLEQGARASGHVSPRDLARATEPGSGLEELLEVQTGPNLNEQVRL